MKAVKSATRKGDTADTFRIAALLHAAVCAGTF